MNKKAFFKRLAVVQAAALASAGAAHAALPTAASTAITDATTDMQTAAVSILTGMVVFWGVKTLGRKMGWWA
nr:major capsid protein [uncultured Rhodoferax sp.]